MTHLSLFTGIGGLDLAAEWAGFETVGQCEWADYPTKVLEKHWPDVPRWRDIRTLTGESFYERTGLRTVDIISGGFPCQPFSVAGKQKGKEDDRYLWPEMLRVIRELAPRWVVGENVPGIIKIAGGRVVQDLEQAGYHVVVFNFEAAAVGAPHRRARCAFVANASSAGVERRDQTASAVTDERSWEGQPDAESVQRNAADTNGEVQPNTVRTRGWRPGSCDKDWWSVEPDVGRVAHGIPDRVDRLKCLGNAVVPQQFYPIFKAIAETERMMNRE